MNTSGWDVVSSLSLATANAQLLRNTAVTGAAFNFTYQPQAATTVVVAGHFASWQLVPGGSGQKVHLAVTLADGTFTMTTAAPLALAGVVVTLEIPLSFVTGSRAGSQQLGFDFSTTGPVPSQQVVMVLPAGSATGSLDLELVKMAIAQCVYSNPASTSHVFATLVPGGDFPATTLGGATDGSIQSDHMSLGPLPIIPVSAHPDEGLYLYNFPLISSYAFEYTAAAGSAGVEYLTIYSQAQISGDPVPAVTTQIDPSLVDFASPACVALSARYFLKYVLMPQLPAAYHLRPATATGSLFTQSPDIGRFHYQNDQITITDTIALPAVSVNGISYDTWINHLTISIVGTQLKTVLDGESDITSGVSVQFSYTSLSTPGVVNGQLVFAPDPNPVTDHRISMSDTATVENVLSLDTLNGISRAVGNSIAHSINNNLDAFGATQLNPNFVQWTDYSMAALTNAGLNDVFYAQGTTDLSPATGRPFSGGFFPGQGIPQGPHGIIPFHSGAMHLPGH